MAEVWLWYAQDDNAGTNTITTGHELSWWGSVAVPAYATPIPLGEYNSNTHMEVTDTSDACITDHTNNTRYVTGTEIVINELGGTQTLAAGIPTEAECPLEIMFEEDGGATVITGAEFFIFDQSTETNPPTNIVVFGLEQGDTTWTAMTGGSATPVTLTDQGSATTHSYYIAISVRPTATGVQNAFRMKCTLTYQ